MNETRPGMGHPQMNPTAAPIARPIGTPPTSIPGFRPTQPGSAVPILPPRATVDAPLELLGDEKPTTDVQKSKIHGMSAQGLVQHIYKRPANVNKTGAVRMRTFHSRLSEQGVEYLDQAVNDWLEQHPEIEVKFTNTTIGMWDGKLKEPTLIINVWY